MTTEATRAQLTPVFPEKPYPKLAMLRWRWWMRDSPVRSLEEFARRPPFHPHWTKGAITHHVQQLHKAQGGEYYAVKRVSRVRLGDGRTAILRRLLVDVTKESEPFDRFSADARGGIELTRALIFGSEQVVTPHVALVWDAWCTGGFDGSTVECSSISEDAGDVTLATRWGDTLPSPTELAVSYFTIWFTLVALYRHAGRFVDIDRHLGNFAVAEIPPASPMYGRVHAYHLDPDTTVYITPVQHGNRLIRMFDLDMSEFDSTPAELKGAMVRSVRYIGVMSTSDYLQRDQHVEFNPLHVFPAGHPSRRWLEELIDYAEDGTSDVWAWASQPLFLNHLLRSMPDDLGAPLLVGNMPGADTRKRRRKMTIQ